jgi:hypothetical protein
MKLVIALGCFVGNTIQYKININNTIIINIINWARGGAVG